MLAKEPTWEGIEVTVRRITGLMLALVVGLLLAGCTGEPMPTPTESRSASASPTPSPSTDAVPEFRPNGSAAANQQYFDYVNRTLASAQGMSSGRAIVDNLVAAGFSKADMEVTDDTTALNIPVDAIQVAVRFRGECLIGQFSPAGYTGILAPILGTGTCLVGRTVPIDW